MEALIRWIHPTKGMISPEEFIPIATESGLISKIGWWIVESVCKQIIDWQSRDLVNFNYVAININARQLHEMNFTQQHMNSSKNIISILVLSNLKLQRQHYRQFCQNSRDYKKFKCKWN